MLIEILAGLLCIAFSASAAIRHVYPSESIQQTVQLAGDGDTILVHDGLYQECVVLYGKTLTIGSEYLMDRDSTHVAVTVVTAESSRPDTSSCFVYAYGEGPTSRLVGITLTCGTGTWWRAGYPNYMGGGLHVNHADVTVDHCRITGCSGFYGGGIGVAGASDTHDARVQVLDCDVVGNYSASDGGGVYAWACSLSVGRCLIDSNSAASQGGGIILGGHGFAFVDSCRIRRCNATNAGGVLWGFSGTLRNSLFELNQASSGLISDLTVVGAAPTITRCLFRSNASNQSSILFDQSPNLGSVFVGNVVEDQMTTDITGTLLASSGHPEIAFNVFRNNVNIRGGAVYLLGSSTAHIHHNFFEANITQDSTQGSAISTIYQSLPLIDSNAFVGNNRPDISMESWPDYHPIIDARNNWWGDASGPYHPTLNPNGRGDTLLSDSVLFNPWLTSPPDTTMPNSVVPKQRPEIASTWEFFGLYPNPFNSEIRLLIAGFTGQNFRLTLHNLLGQEVAVIHNGALTGGEIYFKAPPDLASGVYFVRAAEGQTVQTKKAIFMK